MGYLDVQNVSYTLSDGQPLFDQISFRVGEGSKTALIGANGTGKTTLLRLIAGDLDPDSGTIARQGALGIMRQFIGSMRDDSTVRDLVLGLSGPNLRQAGQALRSAESRLTGVGDEPAQMAYAQALADWG
jgi:ATPase subunit of ABC transporter with duplicated ATPase domains